MPKKERSTTGHGPRSGIENAGSKRRSMRGVVRCTTSRLDFAILSKRNRVVPAPSRGAALLWFEWSSQNGRRVVKKTWLGGDVQVSTVFLGIDHGFGRGERWFETMVFGGPMDGETYRYATWDQAVKGHQIMVEAAEMEGHSTMWQTAMELTVVH